MSGEKTAQGHLSVRFKSIWVVVWGERESHTQATPLVSIPTSSRTSGDASTRLFADYIWEFELTHQSVRAEVPVIYGRVRAEEGEHASVRGKTKRLTLKRYSVCGGLRLRRPEGHRAVPIAGYQGSTIRRKRQHIGRVTFQGRNWRGVSNFPETIVPPDVARYLRP